MSDSRTVEVLLVEDNRADVELFQESLAVCDVPHNLHVVRHGGDAIAFLYREGPFWNAPRPDLMVLDLNLPGMRGMDVLRQVKHDDGLKEMPVVVLSSSDDGEDIVEAYGLKANAYVPKPADFDQFAASIRQIAEYWLVNVKLPSSNRPQRADASAVLKTAADPRLLCKEADS